MDLSGRLLFYTRYTLDYLYQMLPCMAAALLLFFLLRPFHRKKLARCGLISSVKRECTLLIFVLYAAGLVSLTLFPANLWSFLLDRIFRPEYAAMVWGERHISDFYPTWAQVISQQDDLPNLVTPFQEILRALHSSGLWLMFMLRGNIVMFLPAGFFIGLLWRRPHWWRSVGIGCLCSCCIEFVQFFIGRCTDIDDVILNTAGAFLGYILFLLFRKAAPRFVAGLQIQTLERKA